MYIPLGLLSAWNVLSDRNRARSRVFLVLGFFGGALLSLLVEGLQFLSARRDPDIWDLLYNSAGYGLGYVIGYLLARAAELGSAARSCRTVKFLARTGLVCFGLLALGMTARLLWVNPVSTAIVKHQFAWIFGRQFTGRVGHEWIQWRDLALTRGWYFVPGLFVGALVRLAIPAWRLGSRLSAVMCFVGWGLLLFAASVQGTGTVPIQTWTSLLCGLGGAGFGFLLTSPPSGGRFRAPCPCEVNKALL